MKALFFSRGCCATAPFYSDGKCSVYVDILAVRFRREEFYLCFNADKYGKLGYVYIKAGSGKAEIYGERALELALYADGGVGGKAVNGACFGGGGFASVFPCEFFAGGDGGLDRYFAFKCHDKRNIQPYADQRGRG